MEELASLRKKGDEDMCLYLYDHYSCLLYGFILQINPDQKAANEVLKNVFLEVYDNYDRTEESLCTWLLRITWENAFKHSLYYTPIEIKKFLFSILEK